MHYAIRSLFHPDRSSLPFLTLPSRLQSNYYNQIIQRYQATIAGQFFGHSHKDQFEIAYSDYSKQTAANANGIAYIAPALTPTSTCCALRLLAWDRC